MASAYTYDDFINAANSAGLLSQFSANDLATARLFPEFGLSLLSLKQDYANAATDEARSLAHALAEELRTEYGNYTTRADGTGYYARLSTPSDFDGKQGEISDILDRMKNYGPFSYNPETDESYAAYKKQYLREGERATANTIGQAAVLTGGIPSTAAVTAAQQAGDYYAGKLADKVPELEQNAYARYLSGFNMLGSQLDAMQEQDNTEYGRYLDQMNYMDQRTAGAQENAAAEQKAAKDQVDAILAAGGIPSNDLIAASGYPQEYIDAMAAYYAKKAAGKGEGLGDYGPDDVSDLEAAATKVLAKYEKGADGKYAITSESDWNTLKAYYDSMGIDMSAYFTRKTGSSATPTSTLGTSYNTIWKRARDMYDAKKSAEEIKAYLNKFSEEQLTDAGLDKIMSALNLYGYREG